MIIQGSAEWFAARAGKVTASRIADMVATTKSGWGASRANYMAQLVSERLTGVVAEGFTNAAMQHGIATEPEARAAYEFYRDASVEEVSFIEHPALPMSGASPDGHVGTDGSVEIKCPNTGTHIETLLDGSVPAKYLKQIQWQLACSGRKWCDFVSYDPRMPERMRLFVQRIDRNDTVIAELEKEVRIFLAEVEIKVAALRKRYEMEAAA